jgi:hypothetical protein
VLLGLFGVVLVLFALLLLFAAALSYGEAGEGMGTVESLVIVGIAAMGLSLIAAAFLVPAAPRIARWFVVGCVIAGFIVLLLPAGLSWDVAGLLVIWAIVSVVLTGVVLLIQVVLLGTRGSTARG